MRKLFLMSILILIFSLILGCGNNKETAKHAERIEYKTNLEDFVSDIISESSKAEEIIGIYLKVWNVVLDRNFNDDDLNVTVK